MKIKQTKNKSGQQVVELSFNGPEGKGTVCVQEGQYGPWIYMKGQPENGKSVHFDLYTNTIRVWDETLDPNEPQFVMEAE